MTNQEPDLGEEKQKGWSELSWFAWAGIGIIVYAASAFPVSIAWLWLIRWGVLSNASYDVYLVAYFPVIWVLEDTSIGHAVAGPIMKAHQLLRP